MGFLNEMMSVYSYYPKDQHAMYNLLEIENVFLPSVSDPGNIRT